VSAQVRHCGRRGEARVDVAKQGAGAVRATKSG
jgi:hypothetical protein